MKHVIHPQLFAGLPHEFRQDIVMVNTFEKGELHCVLDTILACTQVTEEEFFSTCKKRDIVTARMLFTVTCRELLWHRIKVIGKFIGRHHATVIHHTKTTEDLLKVDKYFKQLYNRCLEQAQISLTKHGFDHKRQAETLRSRVETERSRDGGTTQRLVFTQATSSKTNSYSKRNAI